MKERGNILVVADSMARLNPKSDTSLALAHTAMKNFYGVYWTTEKEIRFSGNAVRFLASKCQAFQLGEIPSLEKSVEMKASDFSACWVRKDPPFDEHYIKLCWVLALAEKQTWMMNKPSLLVRYHEKILQLEAHAEGYLRDDDLIPTHIGPWSSAIHEIKSKRWDPVVVKPFLGHAGTEVSRWSASDLLSGAVPKDSDDQVVQPFVSSVTETGDRRVFFLQGEVLSHFVRMPKSGDFISNLAYGGSAVQLPLSEREKEVLPRLGKFLKAKGIFFAGADVIDGRISEVNITSPTGIRMLSELEKKDYAQVLFEAMEKEFRDPPLPD